MWAGHPIVAVVPTFKRPHMLARCIDSLRQHGKILDDIIVVDGVSPVARARNTGIERAPDHAIILSCDDDCYYDERLCLAQSLPFLTERAGVIQIARRPHGKPWEQYRAQLDKNVPGVWPCVFGWMAGGFLFRRTAWAEIGGYPDDFLDDVAFCAKLYAAGLTNYHSTFSYGYHENDSPVGGISAASSLLSPSNLEQLGLVGAPWIARGGVQTISPTAATKALEQQHEERKRARFGA